MRNILTFPQAPHLSLRSGLSLLGFRLRGGVGVLAAGEDFCGGNKGLLGDNRLVPVDSLLSPIIVF